MEKLCIEKEIENYNNDWDSLAVENEMDLVGTLNNSLQCLET